MSDNMFGYFDLGEAFYWVCSYDLRFHPDPQGVEHCVIHLKSKDEHEGPVFHIVRCGKHYKIAQFSDYELDAADGAHSGDMRHPSLIVQQYHLPPSMPMDKEFLGPVTEINMLRILRLAQAVLSHDDEMHDDALGNIREWYAEKDALSATRSASGGVVVSFMARKFG